MAARHTVDAGQPRPDRGCRDRPGAKSTRKNQF